MAGFDFEQIGKTLSQYMDTDLIDIRRDIDGSLTEVYSNIPCHVAYKDVDNPNPETVDIKPIIQTLYIHTELWVDIRNNDFIVAKKLGADGGLIAVYNGRCGNPTTSQGRKKVMVTMNTTESEDVTPIPPSDPVQVVTHYISEGVDINPSVVQNVERNKGFTITAPIIEGYAFSYATVNGEITTDSTIKIEKIVADTTIEFTYAVSSNVGTFAFLVNGLYTRNDGTLANGWHTYKPISIVTLTEVSGGYKIVCDNVSFTHEDNGKTLSIVSGTQIVVFPQKAFCTIANVVVEDNVATFNAVNFIPSAEQENFYETRWYG